jgi:hypothetical protein
MKSDHGRRWILVFAFGLIGLALGISVISFALLVIAKGAFPALFSDFETPGMFFLGYGIGLISVTPIVRELEQKP